MIKLLDETCNDIHRCNHCINITDSRYSLVYVYKRCHHSIKTIGSYVIQLIENNNSILLPVFMIHICADRYMVHYNLTNVTIMSPRTHEILIKEWKEEKINNGIPIPDRMKFYNHNGSIKIIPLEI